MAEKKITQKQASEAGKKLENPKSTKPSKKAASKQLNNHKKQSHNKTK